MRLAVLTALWRRPAVSAHVLAHYAGLTPEGVTLMRYAVRSPEDPEPCPPVEGWAYPSAPNAPLSDKWNAGMEALRGHADAVMVVGSDDFVAPDYIAAAVEALRAGAEFVRTDRIVFYDVATGRARGGRMPRMGAGRVLSAPLLERVGWRPWPAGLSRRLDAGMDRAIHRRTPPREAVLTDVPPVLDVKSETNLWGFDDMAPHAREAVTPDALRALCETHYPQALTLIMAKSTKTPKATKPKTSKTTTATGKTSGVTTEETPRLSGPRETKPEGKVKSGTFDKTAAERAAAEEAEAQAADEKLTGTVRLRALRNIPPAVAGTERRVYREREFDAPAAKVRRLVKDGLAEEVK